MKNNKHRFEEKYTKEAHPLIDNEEYSNTQSKLYINKYFKDVNKTARVLDFGCGLGYKTMGLKNVTYYDPSIFIHNYLKKKGINTTMDINELENNSFNVIFCEGVLEYVDNPTELIQEIFSKLKRNGKLILSISNNLFIQKPEVIINKIYPTSIFNTYNFNSINNLLIKNKFKVVENRTLKRGGEIKLLSLAGFNFKLYEWLTKFIGLFNPQVSKLIVTAIKTD